MLARCSPARVASTGGVLLLLPAADLGGSDGFGIWGATAFGGLMVTEPPWFMTETGLDAPELTVPTVVSPAPEPFVADVVTGCAGIVEREPRVRLLPIYAAAMVASAAITAAITTP